MKQKVSTHTITDDEVKMLAKGESIRVDIDKKSFILLNYRGKLGRFL